MLEQLRKQAGDKAALWALGLQAGAALMGFVLAGGRVFGGLSPFGLALVMGLDRTLVPAAGLGALVGSLIWLPPVDALRCTGALAAALGGRLLVPKKRWAGMAAGAGCLLAVQLILILCGLGSLPEACVALGEAALSAGLGALLLRRESGAALLAVGVMLAASLQRFALGPVQPGLALAGAAALALAFRGRAQETALVAAALGSAAAAASPAYSGGALGVCIGALAAACLAPGERAGGGALYILGAVLATATAPTPQAAAGCAATAAVSEAVFFCLPRAWMLALPGARPLGQSSRAALVGVSGRLNAVADALADVADTVEEVSRRLPPKGETFNFVADYVAGQLCRGCSGRESCWIVGYDRTMEGLFALKKPLEATGRVAVEQLPGQLAGCLHPMELCGCAGQGYAVLCGRRETRLQGQALRTALTEQYSAVAGALARMAEELSQGGTEDPVRARRLAGLFANLGLEPLECRVQLDPLGRLNAQVTVNRTAFSPEEQEQLRDEVQRLCRSPLALPQIEHWRTVTTLTFAEQSYYTPVFGLAQRPAQEKFSGDAAQQFCDGFGRAHMLLCDGMGTGGLAAVDGAMAANLTARLVRTGFAGETAARLVNVALNLKSEEESGAALDLLTLDLYTGQARLYKAGAAPTLLYQGGKPRWLGEDGLPMGILGQVRGRELRFGLAAGDLAVLFSDGALADGPEWAAQQLGLCAAAGNTPQEMADILADGAVRRALPGRRRDDVTVAVLRLDKTP